jgi:uncharacterized repeat protein (TIGR03943 family)
MTQRMYRSLQGLLLLALALFLVDKVLSGRLAWYIHLRFLPLTVIGIILLAAMAHTVFRARPASQEGHDGPHHEHAAPAGSLVILLIPIVIGALIPAQPLDSSALSVRGVSQSAPLVAADSRALQLQDAADRRTILDWIRLFNFESDPTPYLEEPANVIGFVYHDRRLPPDQFMLSRFVVTCCAADAFALGIPVQWDGAPFEDNTWVQVRGPVQVSKADGQQSPLIAAETVERVPVPQQPYLFP